jgi:hypothetical protein
MSEYKNIIGTHIKTVTTDPPNPENGQMWYNSTTKVVKGFKINTAGSWATANAMNSARQNLAGAGTQTAAIAIGGNPYGGQQVESYDGTNWTEITDLNTSRQQLASSKISYTSTLAFGGENGSSPNLAVTESWNGSSWTEVNDLNTSRYVNGGSGESNTAALCFGGYQTTDLNQTESWNGSSWTEVNDLNTARNAMGTAGTYTSALSFGGEPQPATNQLTESWNGSSWTEVSDLNTGRRLLSGGGADNTSVVAFGGVDQPGTRQSASEFWNGSTWTSIASLNAARQGLGGAGISTLGLAFGGDAAPANNLTEELTRPVETTVTFTVS